MSRLPTEMDAAFLIAPGTVEIRRVPLPEVPEGWVLVRTDFTGLCGTDFAIAAGVHPRAQMPLILGHEISGRVAVSTAGAPEVGTRVVVEPLITCGQCRPCREGVSHVCRHLGLFGIDVAGSMAEYVALPAHTLIEVGDTAPALHLALAEPLAVAVHAVQGSGLQSEDLVVVFGAGPIGVLTALVARHEGARQVVIVEPSEQRRAVAAELGFTVVPAGDQVVASIAELTDGNGADIVFDTAGAPPVTPLLTRTVKVRGTVVLVGVYKAPVPVDLQIVTFAELRLVGVRVYTRSDFERAVELIAAGALPLDRFPVLTFPLTSAAEALQTAAASPSALKVLVCSGEGE